VAPKEFRAFTTTSLGGLLRVLTNKCAVSAAATGPGQQLRFREFLALWDTGATNSVITQDVVDALGLRPTGVTNVKHAGGVSLANTYLVNIGLPNGVAFRDLTVTLAPLADAQMLIGMDIMSQGDFAVTNVGGLTVFSYRYPSIKTIDYAKEADAIQRGLAAQQTKHSFYKGLGKKKHR